MGVIHPARCAAAGGLPFPHVGVAAVRRKMQAAAGHGGGRVGDRMNAGMKRSVAGKGHV